MRMFTGIIQALGTVLGVENAGEDCSMIIDCGALANEKISIGDSIAVNGCCLTVVEIDGKQLKVDVSAETLNRTLIGEYQPGTGLNLELAMLPDTRFGGHIVSGHIDGMATVAEIEKTGRSVRFVLEVNGLGRYIAEKGSVSIDGVSLTVNEVEDVDETACRFAVNIIPHTLEQTSFAGYCVNSRTHIEVDMIARYIERLTR